MTMIRCKVLLKRVITGVYRIICCYSDPRSYFTFDGLPGCTGTPYRSLLVPGSPGARLKTA